MLVWPESSELSSLWVGQNPVRKFNVLRSIYKDIRRILQQAQKQLFLSHGGMHSIRVLH